MAVAINRYCLLIILMLTLLLFFRLPAAGQEKIRAGEVLEKIVCHTASSQSYALYLPSGYSGDKPWPILYAFDPAGQGVDPVERFKNAAERYGYIVAGSNNARNGPWEPIVQAVTAVWNDTRSRFSIDQRRIYATGFSGGARVASFLPKLFREPIAGVIGCGAGLASGENSGELAGASYCGVVGGEDFNYLEMRILSAEMKARGILHRLIVFKGGHSWPSAEVCQQAVEWMEVLAMKRNLRPRDENLLQDLFLREVKEDKALEQSGEIIDAVNSYESAVAVFQELMDVSEMEARRDRLKGSQAYRRALREEDERTKEELAIRAKFDQAISQINHETANSLKLETALKDLRVEPLLRQAFEDKNVQKRRVAFRCLQRLCLDCRAQGFAALDKGDVKKGVLFLEIAVRTAKVMPAYLKYLYYYLAIAYSLNRNESRTLACLKAAVKAGFDDIESLNNEPNLEFIRKTKEFQDLLAGLKR